MKTTSLLLVCLTWGTTYTHVAGNRYVKNNHRTDEKSEKYEQPYESDIVDKGYDDGRQKGEERLIDVVSGWFKNDDRVKSKNVRRTLPIEDVNTKKEEGPKEFNIPQTEDISNNDKHDTQKNVIVDISPVVKSKQVVKSDTDKKNFEVIVTPKPKIITPEAPTNNETENNKAKSDTEHKKENEKHQSSVNDDTSLDGKKESKAEDDSEETKPKSEDSSEEKGSHTGKDYNKHHGKHHHGKHKHHHHHKHHHKKHHKHHKHHHGKHHSSE